MNSQNVNWYITFPLVRIDCKVSSWTAWSGADRGGAKSRSRTVITYPQNGGSPCPDLHQVEKGMATHVWRVQWKRQFICNTFYEYKIHFNTCFNSSMETCRRVCYTFYEYKIHFKVDWVTASQIRTSWAELLIIIFMILNEEMHCCYDDRINAIY